MLAGISIFLPQKAVKAQPKRVLYPYILLQQTCCCSSTARSFPSVVHAFKQRQEQSHFIQIFFCGIFITVRHDMFPCQKHIHIYLDYNRRTVILLDSTRQTRYTKTVAYTGFGGRFYGGFLFR